MCPSRRAGAGRTAHSSHASCIARTVAQALTASPGLEAPRALPASVLARLPPSLRQQPLPPLHPAHSVLVAPHMHEHMEPLPHRGRHKPVGPLAQGNLTTVHAQARSARSQAYGVPAAVGRPQAGGPPPCAKGNPTHGACASTWGPCCVETTTALCFGQRQVASLFQLPYLLTSTGDKPGKRLQLSPWEHAPAESTKLLCRVGTGACAHEACAQHVCCLWRCTVVI